MKKQYDTKRLTDELSRSVFFQEPEQPDTAVYQHKAERQQAALATSQQNDKAVSNQRGLSIKQQDDTPAKQQSMKAGSTQTDTATKQQVNKALKRFTSYLPEPILRALRVLAAQQDKNDYEVLQEAVEQYLKQQS